MPPQLNHTIVHSRDSRQGSRFLSEILGLGEPTTFGPFQVVETANGVSLDYVDVDSDITSQHYAFLISEEEFDEIFARVTARGLSYFADPGHQREGQINTHDGGRGFYFSDPDGHNLEVITRPYGSGS